MQRRRRAKLLRLSAAFGRQLDVNETPFRFRALADDQSVTFEPVERAVIAVVLAGAFVTYGGVSLFVAFFVLVPMAQALFRAADIPRRLIPAAIIDRRSARHS